MITANYFDGVSARLHPVELKPGADALVVMGAALAKEYRYADVTLAEPFARAPRVLYLPDGARCEVADAAAGQALADALGFRPSAVMRWQQRWPAALAALVMLVAIGAAIAIWGIPAAAERIAASVPPEFDQKLGQTGLRALERGMIEPSRFSEPRIAQIQQVMASIMPAHPRIPIRLLVRNSPRLGANALALPDGTIIITDNMVRAIARENNDEFTPSQKAALAGVLAHEIGHVEHRHTVRVLARSSLTAAASAALFGDFSAVAAGVPALAVRMRYSRDMETDADDFAAASLRGAGMPTAPLADLFDVFDAVNSKDPSAGLPGWLRTTASYAASHPESGERARRMRAAR